MSKNRFQDSGEGIYIVRKANPEETPYENPDTQGTITEHSEEK